QSALKPRGVFGDRGSFDIMDDVLWVGTVNFCIVLPDEQGVLGYKKTGIRKTGAVRMLGFQAFELIFQVVAEIPRYPGIRIGIKELLKAGEGVATIRLEGGLGSHGYKHIDISVVIAVTVGVEVAHVVKL